MSVCVYVCQVCVWSVCSEVSIQPVITGQVRVCVCGLVVWSSLCGFCICVSVNQSINPEFLKWPN